MLKPVTTMDEQHLGWMQSGEDDGEFEVGQHERFRCFLALDNRANSDCHPGT